MGVIETGEGEERGVGKVMVSFYESESVVLSDGGEFEEYYVVVVREMAQAHSIYWYFYYLLEGWFHFDQNW